MRVLEPNQIRLTIEMPGRSEARDEKYGLLLTIPPDMMQNIGGVAKDAGTVVEDTINLRFLEGLVYFPANGDNA